LDGAVIFDGVRIETGSVVERSIIGFGARIGSRALVRDGVIGDGADIGARCELLRGARVWPGVHIRSDRDAARDAAVTPLAETAVLR
jgi:mannose-1-phosphate guanylyltransferase